jgi:hypothetical protein
MQQESVIPHVKSAQAISVTGLPECTGNRLRNVRNRSLPEAGRVPGRSVCTIALIAGALPAEPLLLNLLTSISEG